MNQLITTYGELPKLVQMQAMTSTLSGDTETGQQLLEKALNLAPEDVDIMTDLGISLRFIGLTVA